MEGRGFILKLWLQVLFFAYLICFVSKPAWALVFDLPKNKNNIVGSVQTSYVDVGEDFSDVALRYDIGYYELVEANPGVYPDHPLTGTQLIIPTLYVLPKELSPGVVVINLAEMRLYYRPAKEQVVYIFPVGIGKIDWNTPTGNMHIVSKIANPEWIIPPSIWKYRAERGEILPKVIPAGPENPMGSYALRLSRVEYLIHGTNLAAGVGRRSSAGCIRLYESDIKQLFDLVAVNTQVIIVNQPYKVGVINDDLYFEAHLPLFEQRKEKVSGDMTAVIEVIDQAIKSNHALYSVKWHDVFSIAKDHLGIPRKL